MSVVLDIVIKTILYIQCCQSRLRQYVYQEQEKDYGLHCHLLGAHSIRKHLILCLHLAQILVSRSLGKILHH